MESYFLDEEEHLEDESLDLSRYVRALKRKWWLVILIALGVTGPWVYYLKQQPPVYEATALIRFKNFAANSDADLIQSRNTELTSRSFAERVVAQLGLSLRMQTAEEQPLNRSKVFSEFSTTKNPIAGHYTLRLLTDGTYKFTMVMEEQEKEAVLEQGLIRDIIEGFCVTNGMTFKLVSSGLTPPMEIPFQILSFRSAVESFQSRIKVQWEDRSGSLMNLTMTDTDPVLVAEMTNRLAEIFIEESASVKKESARGRSQALEEALKLAEDRLNEAERKLKNFKERYGTYLESDQKTQIGELATLERDQRSLEATITALKELLDRKEEEEQAAIEEDPTLTNLRIIMNTIADHAVFENHPTMLVTRKQLRSKEEEWNRYSPQHPRAKEILQEIRQIHAKIETIARQEILKLESDLDLLNKEIAKLEFKQRQMPAREVEYNELTRDLEVAKQQYTELKGKASEAQIAEAVESEDIEILDPALVPDVPTNRDKKQKAALGGIVGLMMGIGVVLVTEVMDKSIKSVDDIRRFLKMPVLGTIPKIDFSDVYDFQDSEKIKQIDQQLVTHDYSPTPIGEAYRSLRTNLMFTKDHGRIRSLVITSNEPGDGKSFTAANLSITLAQLKSNTLLIDSDLRRGVLHNTFGVPKEPGFSNYLTDVVPLQTIIHETQIPNLSLISCGSLIPNPSELLGSHQMQRFLDEVRRKFDVIVFDSPPLNAATDAVVLGTQVDATVVVLRAGKTKRDLAKSKLDLFNSVPANVLGAILNGTTADMAHPGYSYYHY